VIRFDELSLQKNSNLMKIAVVGATGLVGREMIKVLEEQNIRPSRFIPVASPASAGKKILFEGREYTVVTNETALQEKPDIAIFSAGGSTSLEWAKRYAEAGTTVIDNSSAWRMESWVPLVVPEVNGHVLRKDHKIISNPNCSTIEMVLALYPLDQAYGLKRVVVSTYQSVTGSGIRGVKQLENERAGIDGPKFYPHPIDFNVIPHGGSFNPDGYTTEEVKLVNETRKILGNENIQVTATVVRVPVTGGHSEAVNAEFLRDFDLEEVRNLLKSTPGITLADDPEHNVYPMPLYAMGKDDVFVGRIRRDFSQPRTLNFFVVSDNLRKGAATNAIQIARYLAENDLL
jgi:aspartate-semialdehyde dehydrogenase